VVRQTGRDDASDRVRRDLQARPLLRAARDPRRDRRDRTIAVDRRRRARHDDRRARVRSRRGRLREPVAGSDRRRSSREHRSRGRVRDRPIPPRPTSRTCRRIRSTPIVSRASVPRARSRSRGAFRSRSACATRAESSGHCSERCRSPTARARIVTA
jgi:hypothetical protein